MRRKIGKLKTMQTNTAITFTIKGDSAFTDKNPLPKVKLTKRQQWTERAQKYAAWKAHVVASCLDGTKNHPMYAMIIRNLGLKGKPFYSAKDVKIRMDIMIKWNSDAHGDPENIFGSIADALFGQDKYLAGSFDFMNHDRAEVDVTITYQ